VWTRRFFSSDEMARMAANFRRHPWLMSLIPAAGVTLLAWSPVRGVVLGLAALILFRFVLGPYVLRLTRTPSR
jgi:hypothetical protein